jgi:hypothetical protein
MQFEEQLFTQFILNPNYNKIGSCAFTFHVSYEGMLVFLINTHFLQ